MNETNHPSSLATCTLIQDFLGVKDGGIYEAVVNLKQQLDAVVADNVALKKSEVEFNEYCRSECENEGGDWVDDFTETPATDAALAEVEAKAIEKFAAQQEKLAADYRKLSPGCYGEVSSQENALMARAFADELREGRV
ncbi:hypothetical protein [Serratia fonticola]|uniref:hypothetical protein n=1 Tax=Serratia fonticola TaxID=47917 RepID=UPI000B1505E3|nr:hypothetical protein [Serratia fonticola]